MSKNADWLNIRAAYEGGELSVTSILKHYNISSKTLYKRAEAEAWQTRRVRTPKKANLATLTRLRSIVSSEIEQLEHDIVFTQEVLPLADRERVTKVMAGLIKLLEGIADLEGRLEAVAGQSVIKNSSTGPDEDTLRKRLAERIAGLRDRTRNDAGSEQSDGGGA